MDINGMLSRWHWLNQTAPLDPSFPISANKSVLYWNP